MFERFTEQARRVIFFARYEASQYGNKCIESEHLLLGLFRVDGALSHMLLPGEPSEATIRKEVEGQISIGKRFSTAVEVPLSSESKQILSFAAEEAERLGHRHIGAEHLLLGLLREEKCLAARILQKHGVRVAELRVELAPSSQEEFSFTKGRWRRGIQTSPEFSVLSLSALMDAWCERDAKKFGSSFHEEGQFVDVRGEVWIGPADIEKGAVRYFESSELGARRGRIEEVKFMGWESAMAAIVWETVKEGKEPAFSDVRMTLMFSAGENGWLVVRAHATEIRGSEP